MRNQFSDRQSKITGVEFIVQEYNLIMGIFNCGKNLIVFLDNHAVNA